MIKPIGRYAPKIKFLRSLKEIKIMMREEMKKSDLTSGMVVKLRDGSKLLVVRMPKDILLSGPDTYILTDRFTDSLKHNTVSRLDIMKVYVISEPSKLSVILNDDADHNLKLIWERPEVVEVTMQEVADKLGIPVENLRIKELFLYVSHDDLLRPKVCEDIWLYVLIVQWIEH